MAESPVLLLEGPSTPWDALAEQVQQLGYRPLRARSFDEAEALLRDTAFPVAATLLSTDWVEPRLKSSVKLLRKAAKPRMLRFVVCGELIPAAERKPLRSAGIELALWEPFDPASLRFQINRAIGAGLTTERVASRAPTWLACHLTLGGRTRDAILFSLSEAGAFIQTARAGMEGAVVDVDIEFPEQCLSVRGSVAFSNVPGNLHCENAPDGMGIAFDELERDAANLIHDYVEARLRHFEV